MPQIQRPDLAEALRRKFDIVGSSTIDTLAPELVGVVIVDELIPRISRQEAVASVAVTGDTGDIPEIELRNMDASRPLVIDAIILSTQSANTRLSIRFGAPGGTVSGSQGQGHVTDFRVNRSLIAPGFTDVATDLNSAGAGAVLWHSQVLPNTPIVVHPNIVLDVAGSTFGAAIPLDRIHTSSNVAASSLRTTFMYHMIEREIINIGG